MEDLIMMINFYQDGDKPVLTKDHKYFKNKYILSVMVHSWLMEDGWSVECKGRRIYKDCEFRPSEKLINSFVDFVFD